MWYAFSFVLIFIVLAMGFVFINMALSWILSQKRPSPVKGSTYECGIPPTGGAWSNFNPRFFLITLLFLVFDVEVALIFPVAMVYKDMAFEGLGLFVFLEVIIFMLILFIALIYSWARGDLEWIKK